MNKFNIAIDGYSSCGKSTLAKELARKLGYIYVDSGAMYRAVTLYGMRKGLVADGKVDAPGLVAVLDDIKISFIYNRFEGKSETYLNGENVEQEIRLMEVSNHVSQVSVIKEVRTKLKAIQQGFGSDKGVVMDGRDIGTVILPHAPLKIFMTASPEVRAQRRFEELQSKGVTDITYESVLANLTFRDKEDSSRAESPLKRADDAVIIDNTELTPEEQLDIVLGLAISTMATRDA